MNVTCRTGRVLLIGTLLCLAVVASPSSADVASIAVGNGYFSPKITYTEPGTTARFEWLDGRHRLLAYRGATWDSGEKGTPATYQVGFGGGTVRFRCSIHSNLDASGFCTGMCGILTDDPTLDTREPTALIVRPRRGEVITPIPDLDASRVGARLPVTIEGTAWDNVGVVAVAVRIWDNAGRSYDSVAECTECTAASVTWRARLSLLPGSYIVEAAAADAAGNKYLTPRRTFFVV